MTGSSGAGSTGPRPIGIVGAGTMGTGIAQVAAVAGRPVRIADAVPGAAERAVAGIRDRVKAQAARGRLSADPDALDLAAVESGDGLVELPSGALLVQCEGVTATSLSAAFERPVIVVDRVLDPAAATAIAIAPSDGCPPAALTEATGLFQAAGLDVYVTEDTPGLIVTRTVAMLANLAADALASRVASERDIDTAMRLGVNYPLGPLAWARQWGIPVVLRILDSLENWYRDGHYRASPLLRRTALAQRGPAVGRGPLPRQGRPGTAG